MVLILIGMCKKPSYTGRVVQAITMKDDKRTMKDVSHTPPNGDTVTNVWERGDEIPEEDEE